MTDVIIKNFSNIPSFGGSNFHKNEKAVAQALEKTQHLQSKFNHSNSQFAWKHLILSSLSPSRNLRQIAAEITRKDDALFEAKWRCAKRAQRISLLSKQTDITECQKLDLQHKQEKQIREIVHIEGAMKDILTLEALYNDIVEQNGLITEADFEAAESVSHISRALLQSIREIRQSGTVGTGNQEYLEQIGLNPGKVILELRRYIEVEIKADDWSGTGLNEFVIELAQKLTPYASERIKFMGFRDELETSALMLES